MNRREILAALGSGTLASVTSIAKADVGQRDVIVIEAPGPMSHEEIDRIGRTMREIWPGHQCVVLTGGMTLKVVREGA